jgi:Uma2 family endonuclease
MASLPNSKTVTYEEWLRMPEVSGATEKVVNREIRIMPPAKWKHAVTVSKVWRPLARQLDQREFCVATAQFGLIIRKAPLTSRVPDLAVFEESKIVEQGRLHPLRASIGSRGTFA